MIIAILHAPDERAWEFWPDLLLRRPNGGYLWGGDAREIEAENDPSYFVAYHILLQQLGIAY